MDLWQASIPLNSFCPCLIRHSLLVHSPSSQEGSMSVPWLLAPSFSCCIQPQTDSRHLSFTSTQWASTPYSSILHPDLSMHWALPPYSSILHPDVIQNKFSPRPEDMILATYTPRHHRWGLSELLKQTDDKDRQGWQDTFPFTMEGRSR